MSDVLGQPRVEKCTHEKGGFDLAQLAGMTAEDAWWECFQCGATLTEEEIEHLKLQPADEAWMDAQSVQDEMDSYYWRTR